MATRRISFLILTGAICLATGDALLAGPKNDDRVVKAEYYKDMERIRSFHKSIDYPGLEKLVAEIEAKWRPRQGVYYFDLVATACELLTRVNLRDDRQGPLGHKYALLALSRPGPIPPDTEWRLVFCLRQHFDYEKGQLKGASWSKQRSEEARFWFRAWQRLEKDIKKDFNFENPPPAQIAPPSGLGIRPGAPLPPPQAIRDPKLRQQYLEAIAENRKKQEEYARQVELHALEKQYVRKAEQYVIATYSNPPFNPDELRQYLDEYPIGQEARARIVKAVSQRMSEHLAAQQKDKLPSPATDPFALRRDPRLAVVVPLAGDNPKLEDILERLRKATGLTLTIADSLKDHEPDFGRVNLGAMPRAWQVMEMVAQRQLRDGRWEEAENGYRLTGISLALRQPETNVLLILLLWLLPGIAAISLTRLYLWWRKRAAVPGRQPEMR